jgi:hypothetical protein
MSVALPLAAIGAKALYGLILWLGGSIACASIADRKGYGERFGLATGLVLLFLSPIVALVWLVVPAKPESAWKQSGPFGRRAAG